MWLMCVYLLCKCVVLRKCQYIYTLYQYLSVGCFRPGCCLVYIYVLLIAIVRKLFCFVRRVCFKCQMYKKFPFSLYYLPLTAIMQKRFYVVRRICFKLQMYKQNSLWCLLQLCKTIPFNVSY